MRRWRIGLRFGVDPALRVGEIGILRQVNGEDGFCTRCFLVIEHDGQRHVGALLFDDAMFCGVITKFLQSYIGLPIKDIGDLDISFTVQPHRSAIGQH